MTSIREFMFIVQYKNQTLMKKSISCNKILHDAISIGVVRLFWLCWLKEAIILSEGIN